MSFRQRTTYRVASRTFEERYARLVLAMSLEEAKQILGFSGYGMPSEVDVNKAWRTLAFKFHPDRGGDQDMMVKVNVAKDVLLGKQKPDFGGSGGWSNPRPPPRPRPEPPKVEKTVPGQSFSEAMTSGGLPPAVDWKFVSAPFFMSSKDGSPRCWGWVMYGQTTTQHVFATFKKRDATTIRMDIDGDYKLVEFEEDWQTKSIEVPLAQKIEKIAPKMIRLAIDFWGDYRSDVPKKYTAWDQGRPTAQILGKIKFGVGAPLKNILVGLGLAAVAEGKVQKSVVEVIPEQNKAKVDALRAQGFRSFDRYAITDFLVRVNGKGVILSEDTVKALDKNGFFLGTIGNYDFGRVYTISRARGGWNTFSVKINAAEALKLLVDSLTSEPTWFVMALTKAAEDIDHAIRTASLLEGLTLKQASDLSGESMFDLYHAVF